MNHKILISFLAFYLMINTVFGLKITLTEVKNSAYQGESLEYLISLDNDEKSVVSIYINKFVLDSTFETTSTVSPSHNLILNPDEEVIVNITIPLSESMMRGMYLVPVYITYDDKTERVELKSTVLERETIATLTNLIFNTPSLINPRLSFSVNGSVTSSNEAYPILTIMLSNEQGIVYNQSSVQKVDSGVNLFNRSVQLSQNIISGNYTMVVQFSFNNRVAAQSGKIITIIPYSSLINETTFNENFLGKQITHSMTNDGTKIEQATINYQLSFIESLLMTNADVIIKEGVEIINVYEPLINNNLLISSESIAPGQKIELIIELTYIPLILIPFIIISVIIGWLFLTKKLIVEKQVTEAYSSEGLVYVKVSIKIRNVSINKLTSIKVIESLPVYIKGVGVFGSIKGVVNRKKRMIMWSSEMLKPKEELRITYKFKTGVELLGNVILPPAIVKYRVGRKVHEVKSNAPTFFIKGQTK